MGHFRWLATALINFNAPSFLMLPQPVQGYFAAHAQRDPRQLDAVVAEGAIGHVNGRDLSGAAALRQELAHLAQAVPDAAFIVHDGVREGDRVAVRWELAGTQRGALPGRPATGRPLRAAGLTLFRLDPPHARILELWSFWDRDPRETA